MILQEALALTLAAAWVGVTWLHVWRNRRCGLCEQNHKRPGMQRSRAPRV